MRLTAEQDAAVRRRSGALSLAAAAGSGKTSVLVERFVAAVLEDHLSPSQILAITFTERAAGELRERVRARFLELGERAAARDTEAAHLSTIHGFCASLLAAHPLAAGLDPGFAVLDEGVAGRLRSLAFQTALQDFVSGEAPDAVALVATYGPDRLRVMVESVHAQLRSRGQLVPRLPLGALAVGGDAAEAAPTVEESAGQHATDREAVAACALLDRLLGGFARTYESRKRERAAVDFDDLELLAVELLAGRREIRRSWAERFELLMVDEFQDTNRRQLELLEMLDRDNLFTVGDEFQAIYGFRHAEVEIFRERAGLLSVSGASLALTHNFRSRPALVGTVGAVFEERIEDFTPAASGREHDRPGEDVAIELLLTGKGGWEDADRAALAAGLPRAAPWRHAEARLLAGRVAELVAGGEVRCGDVAVLLRALGDIAVYERALQQQGLATLAAAGAYWEGRTVEDLLCYLRVLANPLDELALYSALAGPLGEVSRDGLALLALGAQERRMGAFELALGAAPELGLPRPDELALTRFCDFVQQERAQAPLRAIGELIARAIEQSGSGEGGPGSTVGSTAGSTAAAPAELANAYKLARVARRFEETEGRDLRAFLDHAAFLKENVRSGGEADAPALSDTDAVRLMSIHAAKGLEFPVVCVADLGRTPNTRMPELLVEGERVGLQLAHLDGSKSTPALEYEALCAERRADEAREEDRIVYVAMTRARERLLLSGALELPARSCESANPTIISWLAPALLGDLDELLRTPPGERLGGFVRGAAAGGEPVRCLLATAEDAAALLASSGSSPAAPQVPDPGTGLDAPAPAPAAAPAAPASSPAPGTVATGRVHPQQLTFEDATPAPVAARLETVSYSSLKELERCGYRYYLERVLGMEERRPPDATHQARRRGGLDALSRGSLVHRVLELHDFAGGADASEQAVGLAARELGLRPAPAELEAIAQLVGAALGEQPARRIAAAAEVWREQPFAYPAGEQLPLLTGVIDVLARERDGEYLVIDYKSDPVAAEDDLEALVARDYALQRELYALAVLRGGARLVEVQHWFLERPHEWASARFEAGRLGSLQESLQERLREALQAGFAVSPRPHRGLCATCPGRSRMCSWPDSATMALEPPASGHGG